MTQQLSDAVVDPMGDPAPLAPKICFKIMQFSGNVQVILRENPLFWANFGLSPPPWGQNSAVLPWPKSWIRACWRDNNKNHWGKTVPNSQTMTQPHQAKRNARCMYTIWSNLHTNSFQWFLSKCENGKTQIHAQWLTPTFESVFFQPIPLNKRFFSNYAGLFCIVETKNLGELLCKTVLRKKKPNQISRS